MFRNYIGLTTSDTDSALSIVDSEGTVRFSESSERYIQSPQAVHVSPDFMPRIADLIHEHCDERAQLVLSYDWSSNRRVFSDVEHRKLKSRQEQQKHYDIPYFVSKLWNAQHFRQDSQDQSLIESGRNLRYELQKQIDQRQRPELISRRYDHHLVHAATACYTSPFEEGLCAIIDDCGEGTFTSFYHYTHGKILPLEVNQKSTGHLDLFFEWIGNTFDLNPAPVQINHIMGQVQRGKYNPKFYELLRPLISVEGLSLQLCSEKRAIGIMRHLFEIKRTCPPSSSTLDDLLHTAHCVFNEVLTDLISNLHDFKLSKNLILGGKGASNSLSNGQLVQNTPFENLHTFSASNDEGNALGAALLAFHQDQPTASPVHRYQSPYLGSSFSAECVERVKAWGRIGGMEQHSETIHFKAAELIAQGKIIAWVQGSAELGPRALGNRSLLADPRLPETWERISSQIKFQNELLPCSLSILHEHGDEFFENYQFSPFQDRVLHFKPTEVEQIPAAFHQDGTAHVHSVSESLNDSFFQLMTHFYELAKIPILLHTSFSPFNQPLVHSVENALALFYSSDIDALIMNDHLILKPHSSL